MCQATYREAAVDNLHSCVKEACKNDNEAAQAVDIFNTFCGGAIVFSSVGAGPNMTGTPTPTATTDGGGTGTQTASCGTTQRGAALLWDTLIALMVSLVVANIWDLVAV